MPRDVAPPEAIRYCLPPAPNKPDQVKRFLPKLPFPEQYNFVHDPRTPEICIWPSVRLSPIHFCRYILRNWRQYLRHPVIIRLHFGPGKPSLRHVDFAFSLQPGKGKNCWHTPLYPRPEFQSLLPEAERDASRETLLEVPKTRFCNFIYQNSVMVQTRVRRDFCKLLTRYQRVDCPAESLNNMPRIAKYSSVEGLRSKLHFMAACKFSIAFENTSRSYYLTEKILHPLYAGSVPIYWGCPEVAKFYNPAAFINCHDYSSFEEVIQRVIEVDSNPSLYEEYRNAPPILPGSRFFTARQQAEKHAAVITDEVLKRRTQKTRLLRSVPRLQGAAMDWFMYITRFHVRHAINTWRESFSTRRQKKN